ncbi:Na+/H+ antiporter NhaA [Phytoactinopolyspora sp. XMNu-373]|uniref:Na(+)/H(+) antiporter NhaA n=2 Tax=Phytoactinopolyspora mesophila TaxID=2650750 RepID=A0A7K3MAV0_9ACTN|nr:Na+/H+ antiporter NhaA [Phytoactinopolyspora mesophila]NDL60439.1 Na+/H+ antiporter NhaA [Phytoactinopolyspora mesophila]
MASDRTLARLVGRPVAAFLRVEAAGGILLLIAAVTALVWANSAWSEAYEQLWTTEFTLRLGTFELSEDLRHWVNDALMALFFFVVGLEIKYELTCGELRDPRSAAVPIVAAFGGMAVPAAIYTAFNFGGAGAHGWGIPMATDIAFALGVLAVLGRRIPSSARVFLLTLAIVDDIGAISVIALFYTDELSLPWLGLALLGLLAVIALRRVRVWSLYVYILLGLFVWVATFQSGVHATIAGVVLGLLTPAEPLLDQEQARAYARESVPDRLGPEELRRYRFLLGESVSMAERLERALHPWSSYVVLPIFALANAGIDLRGGVLGEAVTSSVTVGVVAGLVLGKTLGVSLTAWIVVRLGWGRLPTGVSWLTMLGLAMVAGIGFTVSLFITGLAFGPGAAIADEAKVGVLAASVIAASLGALFLIFAGKRKN